MPFPGAFRADQIIRLCEQLPPVPVPTVVVLDNASIHTSTEAKAAQPALRARRTVLYYLPPYSPELNPIEPIFGAIKHTEMPQRSYRTAPALLDAVGAAFAACEARLLTRPLQQLRPAA